jgi:hypothetical protein
MGIGGVQNFAMVDPRKGRRPAQDLVLRSNNLKDSPLLSKT